MFTPIPLRSAHRLQQLAPYHLPLDEQFLDAAEIYTLLRSSDLRLLLPDSATKLFTFFSKDIPEEHDRNLFDRVAEELSSSCVVYKIDIDKHHYSILRFDPATRILQGIDSQDRIPLLSKDRVVVMMQKDDGNFGHFCGAFFQDRIFHIFDSMMFINEEGKIVSAYMAMFRRMLHRIFVMDKIKIKIDYYMPPDPFDMLASYSCEITGGSMRSLNQYACNIPRQSIRFMYDSYVMGVDNQNQYCWLWMILYLLCKTLGGDHDWQILHKKMVEHDIIPVVLIKSFAILTLKTYCPPVLARLSCLERQLRQIVSNAPTYRATFQPDHPNFQLMIIPPISPTTLSSYSDATRVLMASLHKLHPRAASPPSIDIEDRSKRLIHRIMQQIKERWPVDVVSKRVMPTIPRFITPENYEEVFTNQTKKAFLDPALVIPSIELS